MRHPVALLAILSVLACHHAAPDAGQALAPNIAVEPIVACVRDALAESPNAKEVWVVKDSPRTVVVRLANAPDPQAGAMALVVAPNRGTPRQFVIEYTLWTGSLHRGAGVPNLARLNAPAVEATDALFLRAARNRCAPNAGGEPACSKSELNERINGRCSLGI